MKHRKTCHERSVEIRKEGSWLSQCEKEPLEQRDGERQLQQRNVNVAKVIREMESRERCQGESERKEIKSRMEWLYFHINHFPGDHRCDCGTGGLASLQRGMLIKTATYLQNTEQCSLCGDDDDEGDHLHRHEYINKCSQSSRLQRTLG